MGFKLTNYPGLRTYDLDEPEGVNTFWECPKCAAPFTLTGYGEKAAQVPLDGIEEHKAVCDE